MGDVRGHREVPRVVMVEGQLLREALMLRVMLKIVKISKVLPGEKMLPREVMIQKMVKIRKKQITSGIQLCGICLYRYLYSYSY